MKRFLRTLCIAAVIPLQYLTVSAQTPVQDPAQVPGGGGGQGRRGGGPGGPGAPQAGPRPYADVVTKDAITQEGLFKVHQIEERVLFEIPKDAFGRDILWKATTSGGTSSTVFAGDEAGETVVRFVRHGNRVFMKQVDYSLRDAAPKDEGYKTNVAANTVETIVGEYPVAAEGPDGSAVIDAGAMFLGSPGEIGSRGGGAGGTVDATRSYIEKVKAFPTNIEVTSTETLLGGGPASRFAGGGAAPGAGAAMTEQVHYSMVELPEKPYKGRLWDSRIGYFNTGFSTIGSDKNRVDDESYISRFRLEKKDPTAAISEPVQPIVWYLGPEIPSRWKPYVRKALLSWNEAFLGAGFKNAIVVKDAPNDPDWSPEDARYSVVRWSPRAVENAYSGPIVDPRSGQTISAQMVVFQDVLKLAEDWYFVQCGAIDARATKIPMDDALQGDLLRYVVAHEEGHALGLRHNWKASSWYTIKQLRDPKFTSENGVSASIMDYSRFNYVAQPGDGVTRAIGFVGPYDKFAIKWGYTPISTTNSEDEAPVLDSWLGKQATDPRLRYWPEGDPVDPAAQNEDISDDAVAAGRLGFKNIDRIARDTLLRATSKPGKDYDSLAELEGMLLSQRQEETIHVLKNVGGVVGTDWHAGRGGDVYAPVPKEKQAECVSFLLNEAVQPSAALYNPAVLNRIENGGVSAAIANMQIQVLGSLFGEARLDRLTDFQNLEGGKAYTVKNLVTDVTNDVWSDLSSRRVSLSFARRSLERSYLRVMDQKVNTSAPSLTDVKALSIDALKNVAHKIDSAIPRAADYDTRIALVASRTDIEKIMENKFSMPLPAGAAAEPPAGRRRPALGCMADPFIPIEFGEN
jgi:hypothetical protein